MNFGVEKNGLEPVSAVTWKQMMWGSFFRDALEAHLDKHLKNFYGLYLIKIGNLSAEINTSLCPISHHISVGPQKKSLNCQVIGDPLYLPFRTKSVDACLLAHTLTWHQDPHRVLREADRILIDDGWIVVSSFNPFSLLGIMNFIPGLGQKEQRKDFMFSQLRLLDWLNLLNYEVIDRVSFQRKPWQQRQEENKTSHERSTAQSLSLWKNFSTLGCLNVIVARKRVYPLTISKSMIPATSITTLNGAANASCRVRDDQDATI